MIKSSYNTNTILPNLIVFHIFVLPKLLKKYHRISYLPTLKLTKIELERGKSFETKAKNALRQPDIFFLSLFPYLALFSY